MKNHISTYGEARQAAFRRSVLMRRLEGLQQEAQLLERKISTLLSFGLELEADLLKEDLTRAKLLIHRITYGREASEDLVATLAPQLLAWVA